VAAAVVSWLSGVARTAARHHRFVTAFCRLEFFRSDDRYTIMPDVAFGGRRVGKPDVDREVGTRGGQRGQKQNGVDKERITP